ncbi:MAG: protein-glutamate O-methyltransferase CheR [Candidatus Sericytochromatia bacterium]|nr:protein-glutamate O-methyltransferase CheR [Candidatus Tanganyikabacteria bacterium]
MAEFKKQVSPLIGIDLDAYKDKQMARRIASLMGRANVQDPDAYLALLRSDPERLQEFIDRLTINVSEWFRNPEHFEILEAQLLPQLLERFGHLRIWSAGCSIGSEIYSVAILLDRLGALDRCELLGSDVDERALEQARAASFRPHEQKGLTPAVTHRYFTRDDAGDVRLTRQIADRVAFDRANLLTDPAPGGCHLTICRNVVIYFHEESKAIIHRSLANSLVPGGILFVGSTERLFNHRRLGFEQVRSFFYRKVH